VRRERLYDRKELLIHAIPDGRTPERQSLLGPPGDLLLHARRGDLATLGAILVEAAELVLLPAPAGAGTIDVIGGLAHDPLSLRKTAPFLPLGSFVCKTYCAYQVKGQRLYL